MNRIGVQNERTNWSDKVRIKLESVKQKKQDYTTVNWVFLPVCFFGWDEGVSFSVAKSREGETKNHVRKNILRDTIIYVQQQ